MNFAKKLSLIALSAVLFASCKDTSKDGNIEEGTKKDSIDASANKETAANLETTSFKIDGMTCPQGCAATIEKKLANLDGVDNAKVDFEKKTATVSFDATKQTPEKLVETVEKIADGAYKVSDVKSSGDKAYYSVEQEKEKKKEANKEKKADKKKGKEEKASCGTEKKGGCCAGEGKRSCGDKKGGSM
jgi:periplasmic mercuric ion binding protein